MRKFTITVLLLILIPIASLFPQSNAPVGDLDKKVQAFLDAQRGKWSVGHFMESDGKLLFDTIIENNYTRAVEIGTGTGHSAIWMAWAMSKTGGKLITIEIQKNRYEEALTHFREAGLEDFVEARLGDALKVLPQLPGPFDFVFMDAPIIRDFFDAAAPKLVVGGRYLSHGVRGGEPADYVRFLKGLPNFETNFDTSGDFCVSVKKSER